MTNVLIDSVTNSVFHINEVIYFKKVMLFHLNKDGFSMLLMTCSIKLIKSKHKVSKK